MSSKYSGKFIVIDGIDLEARKYVVRQLCSFLTERNILNIAISDPTGDDTINDQFLSVMTKNADNLSTFDRMSLEFILRKRYLSQLGKVLSLHHWVICDGFIDTVYAEYITNKGVCHADIASLEERFLKGLIYPDEVFIMDTQLSVAHKRLANAVDSQSSLTLREFEKVYRASYQRKRTEYLIRATAQRHTHHVVEGDLNMNAMFLQVKVKIEELLETNQSFSGLV
jgi:thymidylate kinase